MPDPPPSSSRFLDGQAALVTGASRGIGRAIAEALARRGARVACIATSADNCAATAEACTKAGAPQVLTLGVDVSSTDAVAGVVDQVSRELGGLNVLVNNAGITRDQILLRMKEEEFDQVIATNLKGAWNFIRAGARALMKSRGRIVNIASVVGITGNAGQANYAASKAGLFGLTKSVAKELASRGVCVNAVAPGFVETDMTRGLEEGQRADLLERIPLKRVATADEIAHAVDYLVGPGGAYVTGQTLVVDGGLSLG